MVRETRRRESLPDTLGVVDSVVHGGACGADVPRVCDQGDGIGVGEKGIAPGQCEGNCGWKVGGGGGRMPGGGNCGLCLGAIGGRMPECVLGGPRGLNLGGGGRIGTPRGGQWALNSELPSVLVMSFSALFTPHGAAQAP